MILNLIQKIIILTGDVLLLHLALMLTLFIRYPAEQLFSEYGIHWPYFIGVFSIWIILLFINDLYDINEDIRSSKFVRLTINAIIISTFLSIIYFYLNVKISITPKTNLIIFSVIYSFLFILWRTVYHTLLSPVIPPVNLAIVGNSMHVNTLIRELHLTKGSAYRHVLTCATAEDLSALARNAVQQKIKIVVICDELGDSEQVRNALFECIAHNVSFYNYPDFYELLTDKIPVESIGQGWFLNNLKEGHMNYYNFVKRSMDVCFALLILSFTWPLWIIIGIIIKLTSKGPVFFRQVRMGRNEKEFIIIKFRTMRIHDNDSSPTRENDERTTSFGSLLRKSRLDEIPQVINILAGDMSFIGPRPERPEIIAQLEHRIPFYKTRLLIKPGLTGWDQISGKYHSPSVADSLEKLQYDLYYLKHRSLYQDFSIALKTFATMLFHEGR